MATLLTCQSISKHYGTRVLFEGLSVAFGDDEHVGFLGPNGSGKTTFLKLLAGLEKPDGGEINRRRGARIAFVPQEDQFIGGATVEDIVAGAIAEEPLEDHERQKRVSKIFARFGFAAPRQPVDALSGGWRKRLALAREFIREPDLLLMDEPTNHLDLAGIEWLEEMLAGVPFAFVAVSHDRYFLERVADRVVELNPVYPDGYFSVSGNYGTFLEKRADFLEAQQAQEETLANIVRREAAFLKSNSKAQRVKAKARVEEAYRLQDELRELHGRNTESRTPGIDFDATGRKTKKLLAAKGLAKTMGETLLFRDVSLLLSPGTRVGLLGSNGSGKTTLIRVLTGDLPPDEGTIEWADDLRVVVFDQQRETLPQDVTLREALAGRNQSVDFRGRSVHITAWAKRFLFRIDQLDMPVGDLSGGEQARILIARLMLHEADVLVLDEPTNDLDIASLDILEESLCEFPGAIVLVSHDRFMLDRVCTEMVGLHGGGLVGHYADREQWQVAEVRRTKGDRGDAAKTKSKKPKKKGDRSALTASEKKELADMEDTIQDADARVEECRLAAEDPAVASDHVELERRWEALAAAKKHVEALYARWEALEEKARGEG